MGTLDKFEKKAPDPREQAKKQKKNESDQFKKAVCMMPGCRYRVSNYCVTCFEKSGLDLSKKGKYAVCNNSSRQCFLDHKADEAYKCQLVRRVAAREEAD